MLGDALRELFAARGPEIVQDGHEFGAALHDWLSPDEAEPGEINLLVDAVRFGAPQQLGQLLANAADGREAVMECARSLAHNRGGGAEETCAWAIATVGYGLGLLSVSQVSSFPPPVSRRPGAPATQGGAAESADDTLLKPVEPTLRKPVVFDATPGPPAPTRSSRPRPVLVIALAATAGLLAAGLGAGIVLMGRDDSGGATAVDDPTTRPDGSVLRTHTSAATATATATDTPAASATEDDATARIDPATHLHRGPLSDSELVVTAFTGTFSQLIVVDVDTGESTPLTEGPADELASISPDRRRISFLQRTGVEGRRPQIMDLKTGTSSDLLGTLGPCAYGNRPSFSPDGTQVALVCTDDERTPTGLFVLDLEGNLVQKIDVAPRGLWGAPSWTSDDEIVFTRIGGPQDPETLWSVSVTSGEPRLLVDDGGYDSHPDYDPVSGQLMFLHATGADAYAQATSGDETGELWYLDDGEARPAGGPTNIGHPALSPNGARVAFAIESDGQWMLGVAPVEDLDAVQVLNVPISEPAAAPAWGTR